jgi:serine/threonine-protein kinase
VEEVVSEGSTIGSYRVLHKLGAGGMGVVYVGEHTLLGRKAAIKVLLPELSAQSEIVHRFFNEAKAVTQIADPGIVQVFDFGFDHSGSAFIIMELLEGEALDRRLHRVGRLPPVEAVRLMRLICTSLHAAHRKGIIHRDLKPENIFVVGDPAVTGGERAKILDFGIAKLSRDEPGVLKTRTGMVMGTPVYMSPEQCRGAGEVDHRSDIYSIGCVMMTMLTGLPPFSGAGSGELIVAHMQAAPPLAASRVPGLPPILDKILSRCLAKDPGQRFQTMAELAQALGQAELMAHGGSVAPSGSAGFGHGWAMTDPPGYASVPTTQPPGYSTDPTSYSAPGHAAPGHAALGAPDPATKPTTLSSASGIRMSGTGRRTLGVALIGGGVVAVAAVMIAVVVLRGPGPGIDGPMLAPRSGTAAGVEPAAEPVVRDAAVVALPPDAAPVVVTAPPDAGAIDAPAVVEIARDAAAPVVRRPKPPKHTSGGNENVRPNGPGSASTVDRGD